MMKTILLVLLSIISGTVWGGPKYKVVEVETNLGTMKIKLYENTPLHSENFLKLAETHHYDGLLFHRVVGGFMIQGGASDSRGAAPGKVVGTSQEVKTIDAEIRPENRHFKSAVAAARQSDMVNPLRKSSGEQFYIVQGKVYTDEELDMIEDRKLYMAKSQFGAELYKQKQQEHIQYMRAGQMLKADSVVNAVRSALDAHFKDYKEHLFPPEVRDMYKTVGGVPFLDGEYTVFGEVMEGMEVIDKIASSETDKNERPLEDVVILQTVLKRK